MTIDHVILITHENGHVTKYFVPSYDISRVLMDGSTLRDRENWTSPSSKYLTSLKRTAVRIIEVHEYLDRCRPRPEDEQYLKRKARVAAGEIGQDDTDVESDSEESVSKSIKIE